MIVTPPLSAGAVHESVTVPFCWVAVRPVIAAGTVAAGTTGWVAVDHGLEPTAFTAATRKIVLLPLARPVTAAVVAVETGFEKLVHVPPPSLDD